MNNIPDFLIEMSKQMRSQPNRCTAHPFWQVRNVEYVPTEEGYSDIGFWLMDDDGEFFCSWADDEYNAKQYLWDNYRKFCKSQVCYLDDPTPPEAQEEFFDSFFDSFDVDGGYWPDEVYKIYAQEVEKVISTHLTKHDAEWFIKRKKHDYPNAYTYVESAYWSPQIKQLQDWIIGLTEEAEK